jgi:hypothetical protein
MRNRLGQLIRWLLGLSKQNDRLLDEYLQRNRESLERQRREFAKVA